MQTVIESNDGWTQIRPTGVDEPIVKVYNDYFNSQVPFSKEMASLIASKIDEMLDELPHICESCDFIEVRKGTNELMTFYWHYDDDWKYGIRTKKDALKLAKHFISLYMMDELPSSEKRTCEIRPSLTGTKAYVNGEHIATFVKSSDARDFYDEAYDGEINGYGLKSHSHKWDRSIRTNHFNKEDTVRYCHLLMDYMDTWEECD